MRPFPALAALIAVLAAAAPAAAVVPVGGGRAPIVYGPEGLARESARIRFAMLGDDRTLGVDIDIEYAPGAKPSGRDVVAIAREAPTAIEARTDDGRALEVRATAAPSAIITLPDSGDPPRRVHVRIEQPMPSSKRFGWRYAWAEVQSNNHSFDVAHDVIATVLVPRGASLPGFACRPVDDRDECTRVMPHHLERVPLVLPAPLDPIGVALLLITTGASFYGFERMRRKRAAEHVEHARVIAPIEQPPQDQRGGAYREAPARAVAPPAGDATAALATLRRRSRLIAATAVASTAAVAVLAAGHSPWPMPSVTAAWIALVGFVSALAVERA